MAGQGTTIRTATPAHRPMLGAAVFAACLVSGLSSAARAQDANDVPRILNRPALTLRSSISPLATTLPTPEQLKTVRIDPALRAMVEQMKDPSFAVREQASRTLVESAPDKMQLYAMLVPGTDLTPEQRYRLLTALRESLVLTPRGALGISMQPFQMNANDPLEIRVTDLLPGLPAEQVLRVGDRITLVDGEPLRAFDDLLVRVQLKKPGEKVALTVIRPRVDNDNRPIMDANNQPQTDTLQVELTLGSAELLRNFNQQQGQLNQQFRMNMASPVEMARRAEADTAMRRLSPEPQPIAVAGACPLVVVEAERTASDRGRTVLDPEVEAHPLIQQMILQKQQIANGQFTREQVLLLQSRWDLQVTDLYLQMQNASLTPQQQSYLQRVIERLAELIEQ